MLSKHKPSYFHNLGLSVLYFFCISTTNVFPFVARWLIIHVYNSIYQVISITYIYKAIYLELSLDKLGLAVMVLFIPNYLMIQDYRSKVLIFHWETGLISWYFGLQNMYQVQLTKYMRLTASNSCAWMYSSISWRPVTEIVIKVEKC